ncbi:MAG: dihydrodipicolinate synthase family protein [Bryobacteraceae bacterium]|nr:dihydrodipicolinate synthase family protein [Bryobacteraceae bacterium]
MGSFERLRKGCVIPAHPLALTPERKLDERRQRALTRYYLDAGAGGVAVGVHTTQFVIREAGLLEPVLVLAAEEARGRDVALVAGVCGERRQALAEAELAARLKYDAVLLSLGALRDATLDRLVDHVRAVAEVMPVVGFYLQPAVGGRMLPYAFWRQAAEIQKVVAIKVAPFNRYQTLDVMRAVAESGRAGEIALYTGNDDNIIPDLVTPYRFGEVTVRFAGGLLGQWAVWTREAVRVHRDVKATEEWLALGQQLTDANAALFDAANGFHGCIAGIHEVLRRQGLLCGRWCLDPNEDLSPGQMEEIDRVVRAYPHLTDDAFVRENLDRWLR